MLINDPTVVAEVAAAFEDYERALLVRDLAAMDEAFWDDDAVVRYGITDMQHGGREVAVFRRVAPTIDPTRRLFRTVVTAFGRDFATVSTLFASEGEPGKVGRQMQTWARLDGRWRIVAAHVSLVDLAAAGLGEASLADDARVTEIR